MEIVNYLIETTSKIWLFVEKHHKIFTCLWSIIVFTIFVLYTSEPGNRFEYVQHLGKKAYNNAYLSILGPAGTSIVGIEFIKKCLFSTLDFVKSKVKNYDHNYVRVIKEFKTLKCKQDLTRLFNNLDEQYYEYSKIQHEKKNKKYIVEYMELVVDIIKIEAKYKIDNTNDAVAQSPKLIKLINKLDSFVNSYGICGKKLETKVINPLLSFIADGSIVNNGPQLNAIFLVGAPGVGKTHFVKTLVDIIGAKLYIHNPKNKVGVQNFVNYAVPLSKQYSKFSMFLKVIIESGKTTSPSIIFIDEVDKMGAYYANIMLEILGDSTNRHMHFSGFGDITLTIPKNVLIICASNVTLKQLAENNKSLVPLISRFEEIHISMGKEFQSQYAVDYLRSHLEHMSEEDNEYVKKIIDKNYEGLREIINLLNLYIIHTETIKRLSKYKQVRSKSEYIKSSLSALTALSQTKMTSQTKLTS